MRGAVLALALLVAAGCEDRECPVETFAVNVAGTCGAPTRAILSTAGCRITLTDETGTAGLPAHGQLNQAVDLPRQGNWQIYGPACTSGDPKCQAPTEFRRCFATRVQWHLELACVDGSGAPVCQAQLTE